MIQPSPLHRKIITAAGPQPVAWWWFEEGSGLLAADSSGNGYDAVLTGFSTEDWEPGAGPGSNYSLLFKNPYYGTIGNIEALNFDRLDPFSVSFHFKPALLSSKYAVCKMDGAVGWAIRMWSNSPDMTIEFLLVSEWSGNMLQVRQDLPGIPVGEWHHCAATYSGISATPSDVNIYMDGSPVAVSVIRNSLTGTTKTQGIAMLGRRFVDTSSLRGNLDDVRIYNQELSAAQVAQISSEYY